MTTDNAFRTKLTMGQIAAIVLLAFVVFVTVVPHNRPVEVPTTITSTVEVPTTTASGTITMSKFLALQSGISYTDAIEILGDSGEESSRSRIGNIDTVMYSWKNPGFLGGNMNAIFQNDRLVSKAQFGLR